MSSADSSASHDHAHERFSLPLFAFTVLTTLALLLGALRLLAPGVWDAQWIAGAGHALAAFLAISLFNAFIEYFFHRYLLHRAPVPWLSRLYKQHTLHHALTRIARRAARDGRGILFIENKFPIVEPEQGEASFFPWYALGIFALVITPLLALLHLLLPAFPWFVSGYAALASSITLYEVLHAINHWSLERWEPLLTHRVWGAFWRPIYGFHLRHHAVIDCNESISGFFGLPVADWVFGTCVIPQTVYADGEASTPEKFASPRPRALIRWIDRLTHDAVAHRRAAARTDAAAGLPGRDDPASAAPTTTAENILGWITHGAGLGVSIAALTLLIVFSSLRGDAWHVVSFTVFGLTLLVLCTCSTLHHAARSDRGRRMFSRLRQAAVVILLAGTYTPFLLTSLRGPWGWSLFGVVWGLCGAGAVFLVVFGERARPATTLAALFVGWLIFAAIKPLAEAIPPAGLWLLLAGALCYSIGLAFAMARTSRGRLAVHHTFVLGGSLCHVLAALIFLLPHPV